MLRYLLLVVHAIELILYTWLVHDFATEGPFDWFVEVLGLALLVRLIIIMLTFLLARTPLSPPGMAFGALAAEYFAAVYLFSYALIRSTPSFAAPETEDDQLPILFVHGFSCNAGFWTRYLHQFRQSWGGHLATVNLEPVFGRIEDYASVISSRIGELQNRSGQTHCLIVCHSMGGLATRHLLRNETERERVAGVITLGTPHSGTLLAQFAMAENSSQMRRLSAWLTRLKQDEAGYTLPPVEALVGTHDNIVSPQECAAYDYATNTYMTGISHLAMALNHNVMDWTLARCERLSHQFRQKDLSESSIRG